LPVDEGRPEEEEELTPAEAGAEGGRPVVRIENIVATVILENSLRPKRWWCAGVCWFEGI